MKKADKIPYKRINIFAGHYGSGKTEVAVNYAFMLNNLGYKTAIVDLDIVNPFFRTADAAKFLEDRGIKVLLPMYANTNVDIPAIPQEIYSLFENKEYHVVLDIGGDDLGAKAIARFYNEIVSDEYELFYVVNAKRPFTDTLEKIDEMKNEIEESARLKFTGIVNNTNLLGDTDIDLLSYGDKILNDYTNKTGLPVCFKAVMADRNFDLADDGTPVLQMIKTVRLPWDK